MSTRAQVESLLSIITEAAYNALEQYETTGVPAPILDSTKEHPLDQVDDSIALKKMISQLEGACEQLCTTLAPPSHTIMNVRLQLLAVVGTIIEATYFCRDLKTTVGPVFGLLSSSSLQMSLWINQMDFTSMS